MRASSRAHLGARVVTSSSMISEAGKAIKIAKALHAFEKKWRDGRDRSGIYEDAGVDEPELYIAGRIGDLMVHIDEIERVLTRLFSDLERERIVRNYVWDIRREPIEERRKMLMDATALAIVSDDEPKELAVIQRTLTALDPGDLILLTALYRPEHGLDAESVEFVLSNGPADGNSHFGRQRVPILREGYLGGAHLTATGCVRETVQVERARRDEFRASGREPRPQPRLDVHHVVEITPLGMLILRHMDQLPGGAGAPS